MKNSQPITSNEMDNVGETACGATIIISSDTPSVPYHDDIVYFCGQDCKQLYASDPLNSCMAARLFTDR